MCILYEYFYNFLNFLEHFKTPDEIGTSVVCTSKNPELQYLQSLFKK